MDVPRTLRPLALGIAVLLASLLLAGQVAVITRSLPGPTGYDQPRVHLNSKNSTRFVGGNLTDVAVLVSRAVYPATEVATRPSAVILYDPEDWQGALVAASLLRPLNAVLLPGTGEPELLAEIARLDPLGVDALDGAQLLLLNDVPDPNVGLAVRQVNTLDIPALLAETDVSPRHVVLVDPDDPATAILAAPWATFASDLVVFDGEQTPAPAANLPTYALGDAGLSVTNVGRIGGRTPAHVAVNLAQYQDLVDPFFGWGMNSETLTGYRGFILARSDVPGMAVLSANLARRGKPGPLLWSEERHLPQVVNNYLWTQRPAFWVTPAEGPFHHVWVLGGEDLISYPAQAQADYALEIGPYREKGVGAASMDMLSTAWILFGFASAVWIAFHETKWLPGQNWVMRLAWPLLALMLGPFGILFYCLAYRRPIVRRGEMTMWDRPLWLQGLAATASSVGFGGALMVLTGYIATFFGLPLIPGTGPLFWLGAPMILVMIMNYVVAVLVAWLVFQTPMLSMFYGLSYARTLPKALPVVLISMASVSLAMFPGMWWLMMWNLPMMPDEESILWFGVMYFTVFMGLLIAWPFNYLLVRAQRKSGMM